MSLRTVAEDGDGFALEVGEVGVVVVVNRGGHSELLRCLRKRSERIVLAAGASRVHDFFETRLAPAAYFSGRCPLCFGLEASPSN